MILLDYVIPSLILLSSILSLAVCVYAVVKGFRMAQGIFQAIETFVSPDSKTGVSPLDQSLSNIVEAIGTSTGSGVQRAINGSFGGTIKNTNAELNEQLMQENPQLATHVTIKKALPKNLQKGMFGDIIAGGIMKALSGGGVAGGVSSGDNHNTDSQSAFNI